MIREASCREEACRNGTEGGITTTGTGKEIEAEKGKETIVILRLGCKEMTPTILLQEVEKIGITNIW